FLWGHYDQADSIYQEIFSNAQKEGNDQSMAAALTNRGRLLERRGNLERAQAMYQQSLEINQRLGRKLGVVINGNNLGVILRKQHKNQEALLHHQQILLEAKAIKYPRAIAFQHLNIGINASQLGRKALALEAYQKAADFFGTQGAIFELVDTYLYIADVYWREKNYSQAESIYQKAIKTLPGEMGSETHSLAWLKLARLYQDSGQKEACLSASQQSMKYSAPGFEDSNPLHHPTMDQIQMELDAIEALVFKGKILWEQSDTLAQKSAYHGFQIAQDLIQELLAQYQTSSSQGDLLEDYKSVISGLLQCQSYYYEQSGDKKWLDQIWETLESNKATRLRAALRNAQIPIRGQLPLALYEQQLLLKQQIEFAKGQIFESTLRQKAQTKLLSLQTQQDSLLRIIKSRYPAYYAMQYATNALSRADLQSSLESNQLVVNYFVSKEQIWIYALSQTDDKVWQVPLEDFPQQYWPEWRQLGHQIEAQAYNPDWYALFEQNAYLTYQKLLAPGLALLPSIENYHLTIIPDGFVAHIPFAILLTQPSERPQINYRTLPYLLRKASIRYLGAASLWNQSYLGTTNQSYVGFAPGAAGVFGEALAYSQEEIKQGYKIWGGKTYVGKLASEARLKNNGIKAQILHIAAHGTIHDSLPLRSALSLAPSDQDDGRLEIAELYNLSFQNQLAILSACESGQGSWRAGEGLISLANGFHFGGCPNVLMSRWAVRDASTLPILERFLSYAYEAQQPEVALRQAQLDYLERADLAHPFFWAGWMISGPTQPLEQKRTGWEYYLIVLMIALGAFAFWRNDKMD
ncbi:MAG: CHAT domain-containing protein, partial [Bacteroidia bacterium]